MMESRTTCERCLKPAKARSQRGRKRTVLFAYCSESCRVSLSRLYSGRSKYHSRAEWAAARRGKKRGPNRITPGAVSRQCGSCGHTYLRRLAPLWGGGYCSTACRERGPRCHCGEFTRNPKSQSCSRCVRLTRNCCWRRQNHVRRAALRARAVESFMREEIYERDGWYCGLCRLKVHKSRRWPDPRSASLDHIIPLSLGGNHTRTNVQLAHLGCNTAKGVRAVDEQLLLVG